MKNYSTLILLASFCTSVWSMSPTPAVTPDGIRYVVDGVGIDQRNALKALYDDYSFKLEVAEKSGPYVADVHVIITDTGGKEFLHIRMHGPILLIDLPQGQYNIEATYRDVVQKRKIVIKGDKPVGTTLLW